MVQRATVTHFLDEPPPICKQPKSELVLSFLGFGQATRIILNNISNDWDKTIAKAHFWSLDRMEDFDDDCFLGSHFCADIFFIVVNVLDGELIGIIDSLAEHLAKQDKLVLLVFSSGTSKLLPVEPRSSRFALLLEKISSYAVFEHREFLSKIFVSEAICLTAAGMLWPISGEPLINLDIRDIKSLLTNGRRFHVGVGNASGFNCVPAAISAAIKWPLTKCNPKEAKGALIFVTVNFHVSLGAFTDAIKSISDENLSQDLDLAFGLNIVVSSGMRNAEAVFIAAFDENVT